MKRNLRHLIICFLFFIFWLEGKEAKGQFVTIPDSGFVAFLQDVYPFAMNGNQLDTTNMWVANFPSNINCSGYYINDFSGIQYFKLLFDFIYDPPFWVWGTINVPELSSSVSYIKFYVPLAIQVYFQHLSSPNLTYLNLSSTTASFIPPLSSSLTYLGFLVGGGSVGLITPLPPNLLYLKCTGNFTTLIPALPNSLKGLDCSYMQSLASLPNLPSSLKNLNCTGCNISTLPPLPTSLDTLECSYNHLSQLPVLPNSLKILHCNNNNLVSLPAIPSSCKQMSANNNLFSSIGSLPDSMVYLNIQNNPNLHCLPELKKITTLNFTGTNISCIPNLGNVTNSNPPLLSLPFCDPVNQNGCDYFWNLKGSVFNDSIVNCNIDSGERKFGNIKIDLFKGGNLVQQTYTNTFGDFIFKTDTGNFTCSVDTSGLPLSVSCPASGFYNSVITANSIDTNLNFGMQCSQGFDLGIKTIVNDSGIFRLGHTARVTFKLGDMSNQYGLHCAAGVSGTVMIVATGSYGYISPAAGSLVPNINGDTLLYTINDFGSVNFNSDFRILVHIPFTVTGNSVCFDVHVLPSSGDLNPSNNNLQYCFYHVNSFDPNLKEAYPNGKILPQMKDITYTIRFQNTGNAVAEDVFIKDSLDNNFDLSSFELLSFSHQPLVELIGNVLKFRFPNINLPDSANDEPGSHGYFQFRVKLRDSLPLGTVIKNSSFIYFDYNAPVQTNTVYDTITDCSQMVVINDNDSVICYGEIFIANSNASFYINQNWYLDSVLIANNNSISLPNLSVGNHEIKLVATNSYCYSEVILNVEVHNSPFVELGNDTATCNSVVTLDAGAGNISYLWSNGVTTQTVVVNASANYSVIVTYSNGCSDSDSINATINQLPIVDLGNDTTHCGEYLLDAGIGNKYYLWSSGETTQTIIANLSTGYSVIVTDSNGCSNSDSIVVVINALPTIELGNDTATCNQSVTLDAGTANVSYQWSNGVTTQTIIANVTSNYSVIITDGNGCSNLDSINVEVNPVPSVNLGNDKIECNPAIVLNAGPGASSYLWNTGSTTQVIVVNSNGDYWVIFTNSYGCSASDTVHVIVNATPSVNLGNDTSTCNLPLILDAGSGNTTYQWNTGDTSQTILVSVTSSYTVTVTNSYGCTKSSAIQVVIHPLPYVNLGNDTSTCNQPVILNSGVNNATYLWSNGKTSKKITVHNTGNYSVIVTDSNSCSNADTIGIIINALPAKPIITQNISLLSSSSSTDNQWLINGNIIVGATNNTYTVTLTGWYSVMVTDSNGCTNASDSIFMDLTGINDISNSFNMIQIIPNPATSEFQISGLEFHVNDIVIVTDALGKIVYQIKIAQPTSNLKIQASNYLNGIYFVNVKTGKLSFTLKLIKM